MGEKQVERKGRRRPLTHPPVFPLKLTPLRSVLVAGAVIFLAEELVMRVLNRAGFFGGPLVPFVDAGLLILALLPPFGLMYLLMRREYRDRQRHEVELREYSRRIIAAVEGERRRIALDLHDDCGQVVAAMQFGIEAVRRSLSPEARGGREQCAHLAGLASHLGESLRRVVRQSIPETVLQRGTIPVVRWQIERFSEQFPALRVKFEVAGGEPALPLDVRVALARVCQEALTNVARHADASTVRVRIESDGDRVRLEVEDDGRGIDAGRSAGRGREGGGLGIVGMRERLFAVGGTLTLRAAGGGTRLVAEVQVPEPVSAEVA